MERVSHSAGECKVRFRHPHTRKRGSSWGETSGKGGGHRRRLIGVGWGKACGFPHPDPIEPRTDDACETSQSQCSDLKIANQLICIINWAGRHRSSIFRQIHTGSCSVVLSGQLAVLSSLQGILSFTENDKFLVLECEEAFAILKSSRIVLFPLSCLLRWHLICLWICFLFFATDTLVRG